MKKSIMIVMGILIFCSSKTNCEEVFSKDNTISIVCSPDLLNIAKQLTASYNKTNPELKFEVLNVNYDEFNRLLKDSENIGLISNQNNLENVPFWKIVVGRDVVVPIINSNNPLIEKINQQGISPEEFAALIENSHPNNWGEIIGTEENIPLNYIFVSNEKFKSVLVNFTKTKSQDTKGIAVSSSQELVAAVQKDANAVGFCRLSDIVDSGNQCLVSNVQLLPIDKNGNGQIDYFEKIYNNLNDFSRGVWIGKYPKALICDLYSVSNRVPKNESEVAFLKWLLSNGQQLLEQNGYSALAYNERQAKINSLNEKDIYIEASKDQWAIQKILFFIFIAFLVFISCGFMVNLIVTKRKNKTNLLQKSIFRQPKAFNEISLVIPNGLHYDKTHTWVFMEKDGIVKLGIDDFLQHITGLLTQIKMKNPGDKIKKNEELFSLVQNGKHLNIYAPVSGTIKDINEFLVTKPSLVNSSPYGEGWVYMIEPSNWLREIQFMKMAGKYKEWVINEFVRLKDFLATSADTKSFEYVQVAFQEGGEIKDNVLQGLGPEMWEDFQKRFIDISELY